MVIKEKIYIEPFKEDRMLHIYIPDNIEEGERFPVIYMYDGHNLFYDSDATFGKSWGIKNFLDSVNGKVIIVGLECNHKGSMRLCEFSPYSFYDETFGKIHGLGKITTKWIVNTLKPYIDSKYPTKPERKYTGIGGSSMGGLMGVYGIATESNTFSKAICISPFYNYIFDRLIKDIEHHSFNPKNTKIYISWGKKEFEGSKRLAVGTEKNLIVTRMFTFKGAKVFPHLMIDGGHNEASWEKELPIFFSELGYIK